MATLSCRDPFLAATRLSHFRDQFRVATPSCRDQFPAVTLSCQGQFLAAILSCQDRFLVATLSFRVPSPAATRLGARSSSELTAFLDEAGSGAVWSPLGSVE